MRHRRVVGVDQRRLVVAVAHPFLKRAHRHAGSGHPRAERVAEVVEAHVADAGGLRSRLVALQQPRALERRAEVRMPEDEIVISPVRGATMVRVELGGDAVGERYGA